MKNSGSRAEDQRELPWRDQLRRDRRVLEAWRDGEGILEDLASAAARLVDTRHRGGVAAALESLPVADVPGVAGAWIWNAADEVNARFASRGSAASSR